MASKAIREYDGKNIVAQWLGEYCDEKIKSQLVLEKRFVQIKSSDLIKNPDYFKINTSITASTKTTASTKPPKPSTLFEEHPWLLETRLVVKPDQLIKRRGKANLLLLNADWNQVYEWIEKHMNKEIQVEVVQGELTHFIVEPFVPHAPQDEYYICIHSNRHGEEILFHHQGGVDIGNVDAKAVRLQVNVSSELKFKDLQDHLFVHPSLSVERKDLLTYFAMALFGLYRDLNFTYLEINPLVIVENRIVPLDMAAKLDEAATFLCGNKWGPIEFPPPFGRNQFLEEKHIQDLDSKTGASLKLTILNHKGRIWTMVAGGGASVVYADTISDFGFGHELANYGEYSGAPSEEHTYEYARTILDLMTKEKDPRGKVLIIGGGIANFTDVALTFQGIIRALVEYQVKLQTHQVTVWVRRGGPNYQEGLKLMKEVGESIQVPIHVYGPETHMTAIVPMALGINPKIAQTSNTPITLSSVSVSGSGVGGASAETTRKQTPPHPSTSQPPQPPPEMKETFDSSSRCIVYGLQQRAVQGMLDFDFLCKRETPSVAAMIFPFSANHYIKFYWGLTETLIPVYQNINEAVKKHPDISIMINFSSFRSVYSSTMEGLEHSNLIKLHAIIAEGVPESQTRSLIREASLRNVRIIGPATVGGIKPGCFRIGNTGGMLDNIIQAKLYRPGSVGYVSKSGGMSNELNNIISRISDGVCEGVAIGGDQYPGSRFIDHLMRYEANPEVKILVLLGEVGGVDEYQVCEALKQGKLTKPLVAWCIGTCAKVFPFEVQFGHAGACAHGELETASAKNQALAAAGAIVPSNFDSFGQSIQQVYQSLVAQGCIVEKPEVPVPTMPMDFAWAKNLGLVRKPANFISSITDDRGGELKYSGIPISEVFAKDLGVGGVLGLLWFKRRLPPYAIRFIEMVLMVTADHGPAVSGAHNTIVTARAGKDLISSLASGLLTIGPRFGGALDAAAEMFSDAWDSGISPLEFVKKMRNNNQLIMGIGHRVKSLQNPDMRVTIIKEYAKKTFPATEILDYALEVEQVTTKKKSNLILNVDGCIAVCFVDLLRNCGAFTKEEADEHIENGCLNGLFVLGRSIGFIGHFLDQKRLKQPLYRHPWDDISYLSENL